jgi:hypothetical protein
LSELNETWEYEYVEIVPEYVYKFYDVYIQNIRAPHFTGSQLHAKHLKIILCDYAERMRSKKAMKEDTSLLKGKKKLNELLKRREDLIGEMQKSPCWES